MRTENERSEHLKVHMQIPHEEQHGDQANWKDGLSNSDLSCACGGMVINDLAFLVVCNSEEVIVGWVNVSGFL